MQEFAPAELPHHGSLAARVILTNSRDFPVVEDFITGWLTPAGGLGRPVASLIENNGQTLLRTIRRKWGSGRFMINSHAGWASPSHERAAPSLHNLEEKEPGELQAMLVPKI